MFVKAIATPRRGTNAGEQLVLVHVSTVTDKQTNNLALVPIQTAERYTKKYYQLAFPNEIKAFAAMNAFISTLRSQQPNLRGFDVSTLPI